MAELPQDVSLRSKIDSQRLLPPGIVTREGDTTDTRSSGDRVLGWTGPGVYDCDWVDIADIVGAAITGGIAISALPAASALDGTELVPVVQSGATVRTTTQEIADLGGGGFPLMRDDGTSTMSYDGGSPTWGAGQQAILNALDADFGTTYVSIDSTVDSDDASARIDAQTSSGGEGRITAGGHDSPDTGQVELYVNDGHSNSARVNLAIDNGATPKSQFLIQADENLWSGPNAAAASGDLSAGWWSFWLDSTNGAPKLMVKAKQADGTVVTGSVTLT